MELLAKLVFHETNLGKDRSEYFPHLKMLCWHYPISNCRRLWSDTQPVSASGSPKLTCTSSLGVALRRSGAEALAGPCSRLFSQGQHCFCLPLPQKPEMNFSHTLESVWSLCLSGPPCLVPHVQSKLDMNSFQHLNWLQGDRKCLAVQTVKRTQVHSTYFMRSQASEKLWLRCY